MSKEKKYSLVDIDGNAYSLMGYTQDVMAEQGFSKEEIDAFLSDATSSDYGHLVAVCSKKVRECNERAERS